VKADCALHSARCSTLLTKGDRKVTLNYFSFPQVRTGEDNTKGVK